MKKLKFISWNVNGIRACIKKGFADILTELNPDIIGIQETKIQEDQLTDEIKNIGSYTSYWFSAERKGYSSVAIYSKIKPISIIKGIVNPEFDCEGRVLTLEFKDYYFITGYFPNAQEKLKRIKYKMDFNNAFLDFTKTLNPKKSLVICGDLNVAHKAIDLKNPKNNEKNPGYSIEERNWMDLFINYGFIDTFRLFCDEPGHYSWWSYRFKARDKDIGWRIDYFCVDKKSKKRVKSAKIYKTILGSDHCPVAIEFI